MKLRLSLNIRPRRRLFAPGHQHTGAQHAMVRPNAFSLVLLPLMLTAVATPARSAGLAAQAPAALESPASSGQGSAAPRQYRFDIPAGALDVVLGAFSQVTGGRVTVPDGASTFMSAGASGVYTADQALDVLLAGTGLGVRKVS